MVNAYSQQMLENAVFCGNAAEVLRKFPDECIDLAVTSPPYYGVRSYLPDESPLKAMEIGDEETPEEYINMLLDVFKEIRRVLKPSGSFFLNIADSYKGGHQGGHIYKNLSGKYAEGMETKYGSRPQARLKGYPDKCMLCIPERLTIRMIDEQGWVMRNKIAWTKINARPDSTRTRFSNRWEYVYFFVKDPDRAYFDLDAVKTQVSPTTVLRYYSAVKFGCRMYSDDSKNKDAEEHGINTPKKVPKEVMKFVKTISRPGQATLDGDVIPVQEYVLDLPEDYTITRNPGDVWDIPTVKGAKYHYAPFPPMLAEVPILCASPPNGLVLDPFAGSGTVGKVAFQNGRKYVLIDLNPEYVEMMRKDLASMLHKTI